jgi:hypothetical protein
MEQHIGLPVEIAQENRSRITAVSIFPGSDRVGKRMQNQLLAAAGALQLRLLPVELPGEIELLVRLVLLS